eukprot:1980970-Rhodomonas_salina.1
MPENGSGLPVRLKLCQGVCVLWNEEWRALIDPDASGTIIVTSESQFNKDSQSESRIPGAKHMPETTFVFGLYDVRV